MWAPTNDDYLSYKDTNEAGRGNSYPAGETTELTLTGLPQGREYKVRMRSRYHDGQYADDPWSGAWTGEETQRGKDQPGIVDQAVVIEGDVDAVGVAAW